MKNLLTILLILFCLTGFAQKTGWVNTGRTQLWEVTLIWDTVGTPDEPGYAEFTEQKFVPAFTDPTKNIKRDNIWVKTGKFYDAAKNPVEGVQYIEGTNPITKLKFQL